MARPCLAFAPLLSVSVEFAASQDNTCMLQVQGSVAVPRWEHVRTADPPPSVALLGLEVSQAGAAAESQALLFPRDPSWFGSFSEAESTYNQDADGRSRTAQNVEEEVFDGWNPNFDGESRPNRAPPAQWYRESPSGGDHEAWQTHFPALDSSVAGEGHDGRWRQSSGGNWVQDFQETKLGGSYMHQGNLDPEFFDSSVNQVDNLGRLKSPHPLSAKRHLSWQERTVNTTLTCADPGCTANSTLILFNPATEQVSNCFFGLHLHPTDFDDQYSGERLDWIQVSGSTINTDCYPAEHGCRPDGASSSLFTCVQDFPIESLVDRSTGALALAAKISENVDECPYENNLLSGIAGVTCLVGTYPPVDPNPTPVLPQVLQHFVEPILVEEPFHCTERGCDAHASFSVNYTNVIFQSCKMSIKVWQTDFDGDEGSPETIEFIKLNGEELSTNLAPGKNPCKSQWLGNPLNPEDLEYEVVSNQDITAQALSSGGKFVVEGKISPRVDECAHNGYLLDGTISVSCTLLDPEVDESSAEGEGSAAE